MRGAPPPPAAPSNPFRAAPRACRSAMSASTKSSETICPRLRREESRARALASSQLPGRMRVPPRSKMTPRISGSLTDREAHAFLPGDQLERDPAIVAYVLRHAVQGLVAVARVMVEGDEAARPHQPSEPRRIVDRAVPPPHAEPVLLIRELGVMDKKVRVLGEVVPRRPSRGGGELAGPQRRLVIGDVDDAAPALDEPVPDRRTGMEDEGGVDLQ